MIGAIIGRLTINGYAILSQLHANFHLQNQPPSRPLWFFRNWIQFREGFGIHIDDIIEDKYGPHSKVKADANTMTDVLKCLNLLKHYLIQLYWCFNALFVHLFVNYAF